MDGGGGGGGGGVWAGAGGGGGGGGGVGGASRVGGWGRVFDTFCPFTILLLSEIPSCKCHLEKYDGIICQTVEDGCYSYSEYLCMRIN